MRVILYLLNSITSKYRNKTMFQFVLIRGEAFGISSSARWNFLESGHDNGSCDGLGASVKISADNAVKQEDVSIQSAADFFKWAETVMTPGRKVRFFGYTQEKYIVASETALKEKPTPSSIKGTIKIYYNRCGYKQNLQ